MSLGIEFMVSAEKH